MKTQRAFRWGLLGGLLLATSALLTVPIPLVNAATYGLHQLRPGPPPANLSFEVAVVKPSETGVNWVTIASGANIPVGPLPGCRGTDTQGRLNIPLNRCISRGFSLKWIIAFAYHVPMQYIDSMITGGPDWLDSVGFEIEAKAESPATEAQLFSMLQNLLAERFNLKLHRQKKELPVLQLLPREDQNLTLLLIETVMLKRVAVWQPQQSPRKIAEHEGSRQCSFLVGSGYSRRQNGFGRLVRLRGRFLVI